MVPGVAFNNRGGVAVICAKSHSHLSLLTPCIRGCTARCSILQYRITMAKNRTRPDINDPNRFVYYRYSPSLEAAIVFTILFSITTIYHIFLISKKRTWYFIPLAVGGVFESVGYIGRILSHYDQCTHLLTADYQSDGLTNMPRRET
jgi:hypothetical protein